MKNDKIQRKIDELKKAGKVLSAKNDCIFKGLFQSEKSRKILAYLLSYLLDLNEDYIYENINFGQTELPKDNYFNHGKITDLLVSIEGTTINLEMNGSDSPGLFIKNNEYHHTLASRIRHIGEEFINKKIIQINFDFINKFDNRRVVKFMMRDETGRYVLDENFVNYHINMEKIRKKGYNKEELTRFEKIIMLLQLEKIKELRELVEGDEELMEMEKQLEEMSYDPKYIGLYDKEEADRLVHDVDVAYAKKEGIAEGEARGKELGEKSKSIEIAKNMISMGLDVDVIFKATLLTKKEIETLKS
jgi:predicted transposase/invertase (TIGR01784 family)